MWGGKVMKFVLVDYMHLAHKCIVIPPMEATVKVNGEVRQVTTTIPSVTIKSIYGYSNRGSNHIGVFFEGGDLIRTKYFKMLGIDYKGNRKKLMPTVKEGVKWTKRLLRDGEVSTYEVIGYEADDLIFSKVCDIKKEYPQAYIDIITSDGDLLGLVDDKVSVYIKANRTFAEEGCRVIKNYYQVTPNSWEDYFWYSSTYKGFKIPYNSIFLFKMLRGDKSDNVPMAVQGFGPKKYNDLIEKLEADGVDFKKTFAYGNNFDRDVAKVLVPYLGESKLRAVKDNYVGLNLKYMSGLERPTQIQIGKLVPSVERLGINLKI